MEIAQRLIHRQPAEVSVKDTRRLVAQIMNSGSLDDVKFAQAHFGVAAFRDALEHAQPGWFEDDTWVFWHNTFDLPVPDQPRLAATGRKGQGHQG